MGKDKDEEDDDGSAWWDRAGRPGPVLRCKEGPSLGSGCLGRGGPRQKGAGSLLQETA